MIDEMDTLRQAEEYYSQLGSAEENIRNQSAEVLQTDSVLFKESMVLQVAGLVFLNNFAPFTNRSTKGAINLATLVMDGLRRGWLSLLDGYYTVAMSLLRVIDEAQCFEMAITYSDKALDLWWGNKLEYWSCKTNFEDSYG